jgi:hypothetical protein
LAALFVVIGFHVAFRQRQVRALSARLAHRERGAGGAGAMAEDDEGMASVRRMIGVMIMAFSFVSAAFADLITYYGSLSAI